MLQYKDLPEVNSPRWLSLESLPGEVWKMIPKYEGFYEASNYGRIKSVARYIDSSNCYKTHKQFIPTRILKQTISKKGYYRVGLTKNGMDKKIAVHIIVAITFLPNYQGCTQINHKDENKKNNIIYIKSNCEIDYNKSNLEWCTAKYNANYGTKNQRISAKLKEVFKNMEIDRTPKRVSQSDLKGNLIAIYPSTSSASKGTGIDCAGIARCCKGVYSKFKGYIWKYI